MGTEMQGCSSRGVRKSSRPGVALANCRTLRREIQLLYLSALPAQGLNVTGATSSCCRHCCQAQTATPEGGCFRASTCPFFEPDLRMWQNPSALRSTRRA